MENKIVILGNGNDWCDAILKDFDKIENARVINKRFPCMTNRIIKLFLRIHFSEKINKQINLPFKKIWFKRFTKYICDDKNCNLILIIYDRNILANNELFLKYIRKKYTNCKLIYMFTNIVKISGASNNKFVEKLNDYFDIVYAFDPSDAQKHNFKYFPLLYSLNNVDMDKSGKIQVFYVGRAKDRYQMLINVYERLKKLNINNKFYISDVPYEQQKYKEEIKYNTLIPYKECLKYIKSCDCILDIIQGESEGFTIKVCEAVYYDKLLITTNKNVKNAPFYNEKFIKIIENAEDISKDFFKKNEKIIYSKEGKEFFSIERFIHTLYKDLNI